jgi:hypothetical protein
MLRIDEHRRMSARHPVASATLRFTLAGLSLLPLSCGGAPSATSVVPATSAPTSPDTTGTAKPPADPTASSELSDKAQVAFRADFSSPQLGHPWNLFGAQNGNREVKGGSDGLWIKIADAEKPWDAVGARTATVKVDGDFDLRGRFRDFSGPGNVSAKLIVVDAKTPRGEAAYVERIQIDGKNLFKFGGEVDGSLENWGFVPTNAAGADLRLARQGNTLHAYTRPDEKAPWTEFAPAQPAPKSMPRVVKVGFKLSAEAHLSAQVRWIDLTLNGQITRTPD